MVDECLIKKLQPYSKFEEFWRYNDYFYEKCATRLEKRAQDLDLHSTMVVLLNGNVTHLKRHAQIRIMYEFVVKGVSAIGREQVFLGEDLEITCWQYWQMGRRYCHGKA